MTIAQTASLAEILIHSLPILAFALVFRKSVHWQWIGIAVLLIILTEAALTRGFRLLPQPPLPNWYNFNWIGFGAWAVVIIAAIIMIANTNFRIAGVTLKHERGSLIASLAVTLTLCGLLTWIALNDVFGAGDRSNIEAIAFNLTAGPGVEELYYRGLLLVVLTHAFGRPFKVLGARAGCGTFLAAFSFGAAHLVGSSSEGLIFDWMHFGYTFVAGLFLVWIRERTGSLVQPFFIHAYGNTIQYLL